jgi:hypothetical protein
MHPEGNPVWRAKSAISLDSQYCATSSWKLSVSNGAPNTTIRLTGISNDQPWEIAEWAKTDADGSYTENGVFTKQVLGRHTLTVDSGGAHSNAVSFVVSDCSNLLRQFSHPFKTPAPWAVRER